MFNVTQDKWKGLSNMLALFMRHSELIKQITHQARKVRTVGFDSLENGGG